MTDPDLWREVARDLPAALAHAALIAVFVAGVCALAFVTAAVRLTDPPARAAMHHEDGASATEQTNGR